MATPPATDKTLQDTTKTVVESNKAAAADTTDAVKSGVKATEKSGAAIVKAVGGVAKVAGTAPVVNVQVPASPAPTINIPPLPVDASLKDISKSLANAVGKLAFDKTLGKLPNSIKSIGSTISGVVTNPTKTLAKMGEGVLGKIESWAGADIGADIMKGMKSEEAGAVTVEGGDGDGDDTGPKLAEDSNGLLGQMVEALWSIQDIQSNMLNLMVDDSADAAEAAKEAARAGMMKGDKGDVKDAKVKEAKAGGFFSKMGAAVMNPMKALGSGMSKVGKGIQGILTGIARGLMAFANPLVLVGVTFLSLSLPILAAGLAAAFKVFDMIAGQGAAMDILTGIIESLGRAIGGILKDVLHGLGLFIGASGPFIEQFFLGISHLMKALAPIISALVPLFQTLITSFEKILTSEAFNVTLQLIVSSIRDIVLGIIDLVKFLSPLIEGLINGIVSVVTVLGNIIITIVNAIAAVIKTIGDVIIAVIENIGAIIESIGNAISGVIDSIGGVFKVVGDVIVAVIEAIGDAVVKVIDGIVSGIERLAAIDGSNLLVVAAALGVLAVSLVGFAAGAAVAGAFMPSKEELGALADSIAKFGKIPADNLAAVGEGMSSLGKGLMEFGAGGALAALMSPGEGGLEKVAKNVEMFGKIPADNLAAVGVGMERLGVGLKEFAVGGYLASLLSDPKGLVNVAASVAKFGAIDATNFNMVGTGIQKIGEGLSSFAGGGFLSTLSEGFGSLIGASDPVEKFQKFAKIGPGLDVAAEGIKGLALAMKDFEATVKGLDLARVDEVAEGLAKIRDAQDPGALAKIGGIVGSFFGGGDEKEEGDGGQTIPVMIAETNRLIEQGFITGPSGLFGSPGIGTSAFLMSRQQQKQITTAEEQLKTSQETKDVIKSPVKVNPKTGKPILKTIEIPEPKPLKFEKVKMDVPKFKDPLKITRSKDFAEFGGGEPAQVGDPRFKTPKQRREEKKLRQAEREFGGGTTYKQIPLEEGGGFKMVGKTRVPIEPLDASAIPPSYLTGVPTGQTLMAGQMESNALATEGASSPSITDASSSTIVNNSNQSLMMPTPDPNPHNMDFQPEHRLFPRV